MNLKSGVLKTGAFNSNIASTAMVSVKKEGAAIDIAMTEGSFSNESVEMIKPHSLLFPNKNALDSSA